MNVGKGLGEIPKYSTEYWGLLELVVGAVVVGHVDYLHFHHLVFG